MHICCAFGRCVKADFGSLQSHAYHRRSSGGWDEMSPWKPVFNRCHQRASWFKTYRQGLSVPKHPGKHPDTLTKCWENYNIAIGGDILLVGLPQGVNIVIMIMIIIIIIIKISVNSSCSSIGNFWSAESIGTFHQEFVILWYKRHKIAYCSA